MRTQHAEPSVCVDISWLPASRHNKRQEQVHKRTRIRKHTSIPLWSAIYDFDVDPEGPEGWNMLEFLVRDVHTNDVCSSRTCLCKTDAGFEDFLGAITIDMSDLVFGVTEGWYALEDNVDLRGDEGTATQIGVVEHHYSFVSLLHLLLVRTFADAEDQRSLTPRHRLFETSFVALRCSRLVPPYPQRLDTIPQDDGPTSNHKQSSRHPH